MTDSSELGIPLRKFSSEIDPDRLEQFEPEFVSLGKVPEGLRYSVDGSRLEERMHLNNFSWNWSLGLQHSVLQLLFNWNILCLLLSLLARVEPELEPTAELEPFVAEPVPLLINWRVYFSVWIKTFFSFVHIMYPPPNNKSFQNKGCLPFFLYTLSGINTATKNTIQETYLWNNIVYYLMI